MIITNFSGVFSVFSGVSFLMVSATVIVILSNKLYEIYLFSSLNAYNLFVIRGRKIYKTNDSKFDKTNQFVNT